MFHRSLFLSMLYMFYLKLNKFCCVGFSFDKIYRTRGRGGVHLHCLEPLWRGKFIQSWARHNFLASRQRQRDNVIENQGPEQIVKYLGFGVEME